MNGHHYDKELGKMIISTKNGHSIQARYVIFAAGYEGMEIKKEKKASFVSTYTITAKLMEDLPGWYNRTLLWETARPYLFCATKQITALS